MMPIRPVSLSSLSGFPAPASLAGFPALGTSGSDVKLFWKKSAAGSENRRISLTVFFSFRLAASELIGVFGRLSRTL